ncbi:MAG TPA: alpha/beta hydrolase, partial [Verrucomicrobium sp.]|nr:alpha/beta hydrolase [Verrucomicrobium sp.]
MTPTHLSLLFVGSLMLAGPAPAQEESPVQPLGIGLEGYGYPFPVSYLTLKSQPEQVRMAYMDVAPTGKTRGQTEGPDTPVVVLLHGKNFSGAYWQDTIQSLADAGFRVIVPDQVGFGKSSKPIGPYSFHAMAVQTKALLEELKVTKAAVVAHSMGGMLGIRFSLMYPGMVSHLVLENPIGLEDYREKVPYTATSKLYEKALEQKEEDIRKYHQSYYPEWKPMYEQWVQLQYRWLLGGEGSRIAMVSALTTQMIYEQPVCYEVGRLKVPALLIIGQKDRTVVGKESLDKETAASMGNYPVLGKKTTEAIPGARLVEFPECGHIPHLESTKEFDAEVVK